MVARAAVSSTRASAVGVALGMGVGALALGVAAVLGCVMGLLGLKLAADAMR
jgi:hypothetical protein